MKENLEFDTDVADFYFINYAFSRELELTLKDGKPDFPFDDPAFAEHLETMKEFLSEKFTRFCKSKLGKCSFIRRDVAAAAMKDFYIAEKEEWTRANEYQESRPDLYD